MPLHIHITDTETSESRLNVMDIEWQGPFVWSDGNFACDCNRADFFAEAGDEEADDGAPCGHGRFSVRVCLPDETELYAG